MKRLQLLITAVIFSASAIGQQNTPSKTEVNKHKPVFVSQAINFRTTIALRDMEFEAPKQGDGKHKTIKNEFRAPEVTNPNPQPYGVDPVLQTSNATRNNRVPMQNWEGMQSSFFPPDPSGAVGLNHYVQMINTSYQVFDKQGNSLFGPVDLGSLLGGGNAGDPIAMYDKDADRWFLSQFQNDNKIIIAISQTPDPIGAYYVYDFQMDQFPDYPKYAIWQDGYYLTTNKFNGTNRSYASKGIKC